jgi:bifunctional UDP-N-acetylglucosamine pyrophosphorylase/glucosamine-1-phosphate N-acetyltransferase
MNISVILAAGEGTRMKSKLPKILHKICGKEIIRYVIEAVENSGIEKNILILGHGKELVFDTLKNDRLIFETQPVGEEFPYGTGFAVMQAKRHIEDEDTVVILNGDVPLVKSDTLNKFIDYHKSQNFAASVLTADMENPYGYGRIIRHNDSVEAIVEEKDTNNIQKKIREINSGIYCFQGKELKYALNKLDTNNSQNEYYITDAIKILREKEKKIGGYKITDIIEISGVNNRIQLSELQKSKKNEINAKHMLNGVTIIDPDSTYIEDSVVIERDVIIYPGTYIEGNSTIGEDSIIGPNTRIINSNIGKAVTIEYSKIIDSIVGNKTSVGPYAYLRPKSELGENVKIGDFVEVKNTKIGNNSKASHLAYLGDGVVGENVNIGCGVIFVNYDGKNKSITRIQDNAFIGSNSNLIAPVTIEEGAYVASGSTITQNVERDTLAIGRARQVNKQNKGKNKYK